ncbi:MAG TPA: ROK family protein, partial [Clostridia bacterium]|nr:ROK family protein [Clostridia bacterium]
LEIYKISGEYLGKALSIFIDILNPEIIAIGSIFARSTDILWPHAKEVIERETLVHSRKVCKVVPAALGEKIGDLEALSIAAYEMAKEL